MAYLPRPKNRSPPRVGDNARACGHNVMDFDHIADSDMSPPEGKTGIAQVSGKYLIDEIAMARGKFPQFLERGVVGTIAQSYCS